MARRRAKQSAQDRYCRQYGSDDPASSYLQARLDTADAVFLDATIDRLADLLAQDGDQRGKDHRRATALGVLATPALALSMLGLHTRRGMTDDQPNPPAITRQIAQTALPTSQVYVHLHADTLATGQGVARVETLGPALVGQLARILGHSRIRLTPVLHLNTTEPAIDAHEIPDHIRQHITHRDICEVFPYSSREARHLDLDHTIPYRTGQPKQTRPSNLGPLTRRTHRAKTHCNWQLTQPTPGVFRWRTEHGQTFQVGPDGTTDTTDHPPD